MSWHFVLIFSFLNSPSLFLSLHVFVCFSCFSQLHGFFTLFSSFFLSYPSGVVGKKPSRSEKKKPPPRFFSTPRPASFFFFASRSAAKVLFRIVLKSWRFFWEPWLVGRNNAIAASSLDSHLFRVHVVPIATSSDHAHLPVLHAQAITAQRAHGLGFLAEGMTQ